MSKSGIVNVRMVITEEKILSNIEKVQKLINPKSKKQIIQLEEDTYFKDLIESIKTYLIEYPKKKNFPVSVYKAAYGLVEYATIQFEENTKKIEDLIKQREENIALAGELRDLTEKVGNKEEGWKEAIDGAKEKFSEDIIETINVLGRCKTQTSQNYLDATKLLKARINNLESNLHIEIDMERLEDSSKALSYIGIEVADALRLIPTPDEQVEAIAEQEDAAEEKITNNIIAENVEVENKESEVKIQENVAQANEEEVAKQEYINETTFEAKPTLWQRIKNSKLFRAATYVFRIKIRIELPNALPEGKGE